MALLVHHTIHVMCALDFSETPHGLSWTSIIANTNKVSMKDISLLPHHTLLHVVPLVHTPLHVVPLVPVNSLEQIILDVCSWD